MGRDLQRPGQQQDRGDDRGDAQVEQHAAARPAEDHGREQGGQDGHDPDQRHESGRDRDDQAGRPGRPAGPAGALGEDPGGQHGDQRDEGEGHGGPEAAGRHRAHAHREQRVGRGGPDAGQHRAGDPAGGQEGRQPGERDAADHDDVDGQPGLAAEHRGQRGDDGHVGRGGAGRADPGRVEALQVLMPERGRAAPGRGECPAGQRPRAQQRALGDQRDHGQPGDQQETRITQDPLREAGVLEHEVVLGRVIRRVVAACRVDLGRGVEHARGELGEAPDGAAAGQVGAQPAVGGPPAPGPAAAGRGQPQRVPEHGGHPGELVQRGARALGEQEEHGAQGGQHHVAGQRGERRPQGQVGQQGQQRVVPVHPAWPRGRGRGAPVPGRGLEVVDDGVGDHPHPVPGRVGPPAEVHVVAQQRHGRVEAADLVPYVPADQHPGAADRHHVAVPVMLALVHLAGLHAGDPAAGPVDGDPGLEQHPAVGPVHDLRAEHRGRARLSRAAQQLLQGVRGGLAVVVQQPDPLGPVARRQAGPGTLVLAAR